VAGERPFAGSGPFDEAALGAIAARALDGTTNLASTITNHAAIDSGDGWRERLGEVSAPTLVIHGTEDPIYPYGNAGLRWGRRLLAPGCSLWSGWATRCPLGLCGTLSCPPSYGTRRFAVNAARDTNVDRSVVRSADGRGAFRNALRSCRVKTGSPIGFRRSRSLGESAGTALVRVADGGCGGVARAEPGALPLRRTPG
jgi:hypothetical protein